MSTLANGTERKIIWTDDGEVCGYCERAPYVRRDGREYLYSYDRSIPVCSPRCADKSGSCNPSDMLGHD